MKTFVVGPDHWIVGVTREPLPSGGAMNVRRFLVEHYTGGWKDAVAVMKERKVSAHLVVQRDGSVVQCVPFDRVAYHAGVSEWTDPNSGKRYTGLNSCSIGIEIANCGDLDREKFPNTMGPPLAGTVIPRKNGFEVFPEAQLETVEALSRALVTRYKLDDLVGHFHISPGRKADPGPLFPFDAIRKACGFVKPIAKA